MALDFQPQEFSFAAGVDQSKDPTIAQLNLTLAVNVAYDKLGRLSKRPGLAAITESSTFTKVARVLPHRDGIAAITGSSAKFNTAHYAPHQSTQWVSEDQASEATVERKPIARDASEPITYASVAIGLLYTVYVWERAPTGGGAHDIWCRVVERDTGAVISQTQLNGATSSVQPRCVATYDGTTILITYKDAAANNIRGRLVDADGTGAIGGSVTLDNAAKSSIYAIAPYRDTNVLVGEGFLYVGINTADDVRWAVFDALALGLQGANTIAGTFTKPNGVQRIAGNDEIILAAWSTAGNLNAYRIDSTSGATTAAVTLDTVEPTGQVGIGIDHTLGEAWLSWDVNAAAPPLVKWREWVFATGLTTTRSQARVQVASNTWTDTTLTKRRIYQWWRGEPTGKTVNSGTLYLMELDQGLGELARVVATAGYELIGSPSTQNLYNVTTDGAGKYSIATITAIFAQDATLAADEVIADFADPGLWTFAEWGPTTYLAGGIVQYLHGFHVDEHAYVQLPRMAAADAVGANLDAGKKYTYVLVYEGVDDYGQVHRSTPSLPVVFTAADHGGGHGGVTLSLFPLTVTRRQLAQTTRGKVLLAVYRSVGDNADVLYRLQTIASTPDALENDPTATAAVTFTDGVADAAHTGNPRLYTTGGVLENDAVWGGAGGLCVHKARMFAWGGEDREVIWYSQPYVNGEPPEFNLAQKLRIPGERVVACVSLDDALIAFTEAHIYAVFGDGPNSRGDTASGSFVVIPVAADTGCAFARSVVTTKRGVYFRGGRGFYLLDRGRGLTLMQALQDDVGTWSTVISGAFNVTRGEILWTCNSAFSGGATLVYDETVDRWMRWTHRSLAVANDGVVIDGSWYVVFAGKLYKLDETTHTDAGSGGGVPNIDVATGEFDFGLGQTQKRCRRVRLTFGSVANSTPAYSGLHVIWFVDGSAGPTEQVDFTATDIANATVQPVGSVRWKPTNQRFQRVSLRLSETSGVDPGLAFLNLSFEIGVEGGLRRNAANASK